MRADRLVATLLLLQARGTVTAAEVANELEVSERTARRDLDALAMSGVPLYSKQGRGGGWTLLGGATTDLTGLRSPEARALMTMAAAAGQATPEFGSAIRKLAQALPEPMRRDAERAMESVVSDSTAWINPTSLQFETSTVEWLEPLQQAVIARRHVALTYDTPRKGRSTRTVEPLGLVLKRGDWFLLASTDAGRRSFRIDRVAGVAPLDTTFELAEDFNLQTAWDEVTSSYLERSAAFTTEAIVTEAALGPLRAMGVDTTIHGGTDDDRHRVTIGAWNPFVLAAQLAGVIDRVELIDPPADLVERLAAIGGELVSRFASADER